MVQKEFNKMLSSYLNQKVKPSKKAKVTLFKKKPMFNDDKETLNQVSSNKVHVIKDDESIFDKYFRAMVDALFRKKKKAEPEEEYDEEVEEPSEDFDSEDEDEFDQEDEEMKQEVSPSFFERLKDFFGSMFSRGEPEKYAEDDFEEDEDLSSEAEEIIEKEEEILEEEKELEKKKENFMKRVLIGMGLIKRKKEFEDLEEIDELKEDLKEVSKITTKVMKMVPPQVFKEFRNSEDFERFKDILEKNDLIKKD